MASSNIYYSSRIHIRHPYVGIIQIRFSVEGHTFLSACNTSSRYLIEFYFVNKKKPPIWQLPNFFFFLRYYTRYPYVGIIQIRFPVEGHTFLSACNTSSRFLYCFVYYITYNQYLQVFKEISVSFYSTSSNFRKQIYP